MVKNFEVNDTVIYCEDKTASEWRLKRLIPEQEVFAGEWEAIELKTGDEGILNPEFIQTKTEECPDPYEISNKQWQKIIAFLDAAVDRELDNANPILAIKYARILEQVALASTGDLLPKDWNEELLK